ncbi:nucleotidyltransferase domain-containing protein [Cytophagaceae bacterium ABcell3]|nr:nucleotidyltransferase domain-containing protein [Cytophagaceae bacterium ABcell3]
MESTIVQRLQEIETQYEVKVLLAVESGSRAWGFPSPDSDYDVRFIYVHRPEWYLTIQDKKDTIELPEKELLDFSGWDIRKALKLLKKSNPPLLEWLNSPVVYTEIPEIVQGLRELAKACFSPVAVMHHYLSMAVKYKGLVDKAGGQVKIKNYFYALRTAFACKWMLDKHTMPPVDFTEMLVLADDQLKAEIIRLIALKAGKNESEVVARNPKLDALLNSLIREAEANAASMKSSKVDVESFDMFFRYVLEVWR